MCCCSWRCERRATVKDFVYASFSSSLFNESNSNSSNSLFNETITQQKHNSACIWNMSHCLSDYLAHGPVSRAGWPMLRGPAQTHSSWVWGRWTSRASYCFTCATVALALMAKRLKRGTVKAEKMNIRANSCCGACMKPAAGSLTISILGSLCPSCMPGRRWCQPAVLLMSMCSITPGDATCSGMQVIPVCVAFQMTALWGSHRWELHSLAPGRIPGRWVGFCIPGDKQCWGRQTLLAVCDKISSEVPKSTSATLC